MNRRELLKAMLSVPVVTTLGCSTLTKKPTDSSAPFTTMNLVFEGPFIFMMENPQVRVLAPRVQGHQYLINRMPAAESTYMLNGIAGPGDAQKIQYDLPRGADAFRLSASQLHLALSTQKTPFFSFVLPAPDRVVALRAREVEIVDAFGNQRSAVMPTSYAFVYSVTNSGALSLNPDTGWRPETGAQPRFANLVVAAGLPLNSQLPADQHAQDAFAQLKSFLPALSLDVLSIGGETQAGSVEGLPEEFIHGNMSMRRQQSPRLVSTVMNSQTPRARLIQSSYTLDCKSGGVVVTTP